MYHEDFCVNQKKILFVILKKNKPQGLAPVREKYVFSSGSKPLGINWFKSTFQWTRISHQGPTIQCFTIKQSFYCSLKIINHHNELQNQRLRVRKIIHDCIKITILQTTTSWENLKKFNYQKKSITHAIPMGRICHNHESE